jgi:DNA-binding response OmpR family regulator
LDRADAVVIQRDRNDRPVAGVIVEIQRQIDRSKLLTWPVYVTTLRACYQGVLAGTFIGAPVKSTAMSSTLPPSRFTWSGSLVTRAARRCASPVRGGSARRDLAAFRMDSRSVGIGRVASSSCHRSVAEPYLYSHAELLPSDVHSVSVDESLPAIEPLRVMVVPLVTTPSTQAIVAELRRGATQVELRTTEILDGSPEALVYVVVLDPATSTALAHPIVAWATNSEPRPGLIGLVANGSPHDCEALLAAGFDDVGVTPASPREFAARVRAVHRRVHWKGVTNGRLRFGELTLDLYGRALWFRGKTISLTSIELAVLRELIKARGRPLSRIELLDQAWGEKDLEVSERAVDNVILRLRRRLPGPDVIETVRSVGFRLASP